MIDWFSGLLDTAFAGSTFLIVGVLGAVLLLISLLLDGIFDFFDFGDGPLSLTTIAAFTTLFGFTAFGLVSAGVATPWAAFWGAGAGLGGGVLAWWVARFMRKSESSTAVSGSDLIGKEAMVVLAIPANNGFGEIALTMHGERVSMTASAGQAVARGEKVVIVENLSATAVLVQKVSEVV